MNKTKPFLKWAGGKFRCIDIILSHLPTSQRLIEPFTGSGAVFVNSSFSDYILGEDNADLINLFNHLKKEGESFINYCATFFSKENNQEERFYFLRNEFNLLQYNRRRAGLFLYLNRHGYNGLCRYNQQGIFNVPFGRYVQPYFPRHEMLYFYNKSQQVNFIKSDFRHTFTLAKPGDVVYCNPPYVPLSSSANFVAYTNKKFSEGDQIELANRAITAAEQGIKVIISNHDTPFTRHYYQQATIISFPVKRFISCNSYTRKPVQELLAIFK